METGERRQATAYPSRLIFLGSGFVLALLLLALGWGGLMGEEGVESGHVTLTRPGPGGLGPTGATPSPRNASGLREDGVPGGGDRLGDTGSWARNLDASLASAVQAAIQHASGDATAVSQGKASAANIRVAVHVRDLDRGLVLLEREAQRPMRPASNQKLITCAAALVLLGPNAEFATPVEALGQARDGVLDGDLVARADGDPMYVEGGDGSLDPWLDGLADALLVAGISRVSGALILDEGSYRVPGPGPAWPAERDYWQEYCALSGGFTANAGCLTASVAATRVGSMAQVVVRPRGHGLRRKGSVTTGSSRAKLDVRVGANAWGVTVSGSVPAGTPTRLWRFAHPDPVDLFGHALVRGLEGRGVRVDGGFRRQRAMPVGRTVARVTSPLTSYLVPILTHSNNSVADQVFLHLGDRVGGSGDRIGGARAVVRALQALGIQDSGFVQVDGSGLSRDNRVSASQLTALVAAALNQGDGSADLLLAAMPLAGQRGSLERRMTGPSTSGRVWAKTGFINGTSALSGLVQTVTGRRLAFSILVEYPTIAGLNNRCWKPMQDRICGLLAACR